MGATFQVSAAQQAGGEAPDDPAKSRSRAPLGLGMQAPSSPPPGPTRGHAPVHLGAEGAALEVHHAQRAVAHAVCTCGRHAAGAACR